MRQPGEEQRPRNLQELAISTPAHAVPETLHLLVKPRTAVIYKGRVKQTLRNIAHMLAAFISLRLPASEVSVDNPQSTTIPFGVAMALAVLLYALGKTTGRL